jgi:hypothetical protein
MHLMIYASSATELFTQDELESLLEKSRRNNHAVGISGLLLYKDGNFMQLLEGPQAAVTATLQRIEWDQRHRGIIRLYEREQTEREFGDWSMGFKRLDSGSASPMEGFSDFMHRPLNDAGFQKNPSKALQLLLSFKKMVG